MTTAENAVMTPGCEKTVEGTTFRCTQRFSNGILEATFVQSRFIKLQRRLKVTFMVGAIFCCVLCGKSLMDLKQDTDDEAQVLIMVNLIGQLVVVTMLMGAAVLSKALSNSRMLEQLTICVALLSMGIMALSDPLLVAVVCGYPEAAYDSLRYNTESFSESNILLRIITALTTIHLVIPIRTCLIWSMEIFSLLLYAAILLKGIKALHPMSIAIHLVMMVIIDSALFFGKRESEALERKDFIRAMEGPSSRSGTTQSNSDPRQSEKNEVTLQDTSSAGKVFDDLRHTRKMEKMDVRDHLRKVAAVGARERWLVDIKDIQVCTQNIMGVGSFGIVVGGRRQDTPVALKVPRQPLRTQKYTFTDIGNELRVLRHLHHPNIVAFYGASVDEKACDLILVLELVSGHRLDNYMSGRIDFSNKMDSSGGSRIGPPCVVPTVDRYLLLLGVARALQYLHSQQPKIVHGDVKSSNILVEILCGHPRPKLLDFGLARILTRKAKPLGGTLNWMAPEVILHRHRLPTVSADVFSFGRLAFFIATGQRPLHGMTRKMIIDAASSKTIPGMSWPDELDALGALCKNLARGCLYYTPLARPTIMRVLRNLVNWPMLLSLPETDMDVLQDALGLGCDSTSKGTWHEEVKEVRTFVENQLKNVRGKDVEIQSAAESPGRKNIDIEQGFEAQDLEEPTPRDKRRGSKQRLGTKEDNEDDEDEEEDNDEDEDEESNGNGKTSAPPVHPHLNPTPSASLALSVMSTMMTWNFPRPRTACCNYHAALEIMEQVTDKLKAGNCTARFASHQQQLQCSQCGILEAIDEDAPQRHRGDCFLCGYVFNSPNGLNSEDNSQCFHSRQLAELSQEIEESVGVG